MWTYLFWLSVVHAKDAEMSEGRDDSCDGKILFSF